MPVIFSNLWQEVDDLFLKPNAVRSVFILIGSLLFAFFLSRYLAKAIIKVAQLVSVRSETTTDEIKSIKLRRVETYLSVTVAIVRVLVVVVVGLFAWKLLSPAAADHLSVAAIGASAFFVVLAGGTIGMLLRDITSGATFIIEQWFNVGDHIKIEPFADVAGVVERVTLRSTKIRRLNGEVVWLHNQHIQAVHVTPRGVRTLAVEVFVNNPDKGMKLVESVAHTIPTGPTMIIKKFKVSAPEAWGENLWRITAIAQTPPGREWLINDFFLNSLIERDNATKTKKVLSIKPMSRYIDPAAERNFRRATRFTQQ